MVAIFWGAEANFLVGVDKSVGEKLGRFLQLAFCVVLLQFYQPTKIVQLFGVLFGLTRWRVMCELLGNLLANLLAYFLAYFLASLVGWT